MMALDEFAERYLRGDADDWQWSEDGEFVEWIDGNTIAHRLMVCRCLERIVDQGLPPFGHVVPVLAKLTHRSAPERHHPVIVELLDRVDRLLPQIRTSDDMVEAFSVVFFRMPRQANREQGEALLKLLASHWRPSGTPVAPLLSPDPGLPAHLRWEEVDLTWRRETGLDGPLQPLDLELDLRQRIDAVLAALDRDPTWSGLARLSRDLVAAVHLPRTVSDPSDLPLGGFSDITNKGQLDRLLLSELAHDDLTLATRVAMNEALYLRRESPPSPVPEHCGVLIDCGVRMWGIPRVFATAVALALGLRQDAHREFAFHHTVGDQTEPVTLDTESGLRDHLGHLDRNAHPGSALRSLADMAPDRDLLLITEAEILDDPEFGLDLQPPAAAALYVVSVARDGRHRLWEIGRRGRRLVQSAKADLGALQASPDSFIDRAAENERARPGYLDQHPSPLRHPHPLQDRRYRHDPAQGILMVSKKHRVFHWDAAHCAPRELGAVEARGALVGPWIVPDTAEGGFLAVTPTEAVFHHVDLEVGRITPQHVHSKRGFGNLGEVVPIDGHLVFVHRSNLSWLECRDRRSGELLGEGSARIGFGPIHGRFARFRPDSIPGPTPLGLEDHTIMAVRDSPLPAPSDYHMLTLAGTLPSAVPVGSWVRVFDRPGHEGVFGLDDKQVVTELTEMWTKFGVHGDLPSPLAMSSDQRFFGNHRARLNLESLNVDGLPVNHRSHLLAAGAAIEIRSRVRGISRAGRRPARAGVQPGGLPITPAREERSIVLGKRAPA